MHEIPFHGVHDNAGFVSGSADHELKFWEWQLVAEAAGAEGSGADLTPSAPRRRLTIKHTRTLKMTDDILCVRISPDGEPPPVPGLKGTHLMAEST